MRLRDVFLPFVIFASGLFTMSISTNGLNDTKHSTLVCRSYQFRLQFPNVCNSISAGHLTEVIFVFVGAVMVIVSAILMRERTRFIAKHIDD